MKVEPFRLILYCWLICVINAFLCNSGDVVTVLTKMEGNSASWKYRTFLSTNMISADDQWQIRSSDHSTVFQEFQCLKRINNEEYTLEIELLTPASVSYISLTLFDGEFTYENNLLTSAVLLSGDLRNNVTFYFKPTLCKGRLFHLIFYANGGSFWKSFSFSAFNELMARRKVLLEVNRTYPEISTHYICLDPFFSRARIRLETSDPKGWSELSFIQQFSFKGYIIASFTTVSPVSTFPLAWDDGESSSFLPLSFHVESNQPFLHDLAIFFLPSSHVITCQTGTLVSMTAEKSVWKTVWIDAHGIFSDSAVRLVGSHSSAMKIDVFFDGETLLSIPGGVKNMWILRMKLEACDFVYHNGVFAPPLLPATSLIIRSPTREPLYNISCYKNESSVSPVSTIESFGSCECPEVTDEMKLFWPKSSANTLLQKSCKEPFWGSVTRWCSASCNWVILEQKCQYRMCPDEIGFGVFWPHSPPNRVITIPCTNRPNSIAMTRRCGSNGEWQSIELGSCSCSQEDEWPITTSSSYVHRSCPQGFQGSIARRCNRFGEWGPVIWDCKSLMCPKEKIGSFIFPETPAGLGVALPCPIPFYGTLTRHCDSRGSWDEIIDHCLVPSCDGFGFSLGAPNNLAIYYRHDNSTQLSFSLGSIESVGVIGTKGAMSILQNVRSVDYINENPSQINRVSNVKNPSQSNGAKNANPPNQVKGVNEGTNGMMNIGKIGKEKPRMRGDHWAKGTRIESGALSTWIPHAVNILAWNHWVATEACFLRNLVVTDSCTEMIPPFLDSVDATYHVSLGIVFPFCGTLIPTEWVIFVKSIHCSNVFSWEEEVPCEESSNCRSHVITRIRIPQALSPQCTYKAFFSLSFDNTLRSQSSRSFTFTPTPKCETPTLLSHVTLISSQFVMVHWSIAKHQIINSLSVGMATSADSHYKPSSVVQVPFQRICSSTESCDHVNFITLPIPETGVWLHVIIEGSVEGLCGGHVDSSSLLFVPQVPSSTVEIESEDSFIRIKVLRHVGFAWIQVAIANILGEEFQNVKFPLLKRNSSEMLIGGLHPNSRYLVSWEIMDYSAVSLSNHTFIRTKPFQPPRLESRVLFEGSESVLVRFWSSVNGQLRCKADVKEKPLHNNIVKEGSVGPSIHDSIETPFSSLFEYSTRSLEDWNIQIGILHSAEEKIVPISVPRSSNQMQCILLDEAGEVRISTIPHIVHYSLHSTNTPDIATLYSITPSLPILPYGTKITLQFTRAITLYNSTNLLYFNVADGLSMYSFPEDSVFQETASSFSFVLRASHVDTMLSVCLRSQSMVVDAITGQPVDWGNRGNSLPTILDTVIAGDVFVAELRAFWSRAVFREDSLLLFNKAENVVIDNGTISLQSLTTNETIHLNLPHPCVQITSEGITLNLARCWKWLPIEHSYKLVIAMGTFWFAGRPIVFPEPLYFRVVGSRAQVKVVSVLPKNGEVIPRKSNLIMKFSQPIQWGKGKIQFTRFFPSNPQLIVEQFSLESKKGRIERAMHHALVFEADDLPLQPNSWYYVSVEENIVRNEVWSRLKRTEMLNFTIHTLDDDCSFVSVSDSLEKKTEMLCQYVEQRCICQRIFLSHVCSNNSTPWKRRKRNLRKRFHWR